MATAQEIRECLAIGDPEQLRLLLTGGADIHYVRDGGYDALMDAVHGRDILHDHRLLDRLRMLIGCGVQLNRVSDYGESALLTLSRIARFDAVKLLLDAGAHESRLKWTPLIRAVALGTLDDVRRFAQPAVLESRDCWDRTAWHVAIQTGDISKAALLLERGAASGARGRCGAPALFFAIQNHHSPMLRWLIEQGASFEDADDFGTTPLMEAAECDNVDAIDILLSAGADVHTTKYLGQTALSFARSRHAALRLLDAGADPAELSFETRLQLLNLPKVDLLVLRGITPDDFRSGHTRRFGNANPEKMQVKFWESMIRGGLAACDAVQVFESRVTPIARPVWCARRFGQSITFLPDARIVQIGGEHEDSSDWDFCIYNDVFVHHPDGRIDIFGYPEWVFPPTDFHTATLMGDRIYIIGSLGYPGRRDYGNTPVYVLNTKSFSIDRIEVKGDCPGTIYGHRAVRMDAEIRVDGGKVITFDGRGEKHVENTRSYVLDTKHLRWLQRDQS